MISELDPVELERLSKAATRGLDHAAIYKEARARTLRDMTGQDFDFHHIKVIAEHVMRSALRTGQLVPAQPSGDEVEAVARKLAPFMEGGREYDQMPATRRELKIWSRNGMALINDATQDDAQEAAIAAITAYEAVSGVAKMRDALEKIAKDRGGYMGEYHAYCQQIARAALGEKP